MANQSILNLKGENKMNKNKQCQFCEDLEGKIADLIPLSAQSKQWRDEHFLVMKSYTCQVEKNKQLKKAIEDIQSLICSYKDNADLIVDYDNGDNDICLTIYDMERLIEDTFEITEKLT